MSRAPASRVYDDLIDSGKVSLIQVSDMLLSDWIT